jgi:hypothetical protein
MTTADVSIATMTRVRKGAEERLVLSALTRLAAAGMPVAIADRGSSRRFRDAIRRLPGVTLVSARGDGLVGQVQSSVAHAAAAGRRYVLYTEPDKAGFFGRPIHRFIARSTLMPRMGIVLAARSRKAFLTFPQFQRLTEGAANEWCRRLFGLDADYFYGPFLMSRKLADAVACAPLDVGWGWRPFVFSTAHATGYRITSVNGEYECPSGQRAETDSDREHRVRQLAENAAGLMAALRQPSRLTRRLC